MIFSNVRTFEWHSERRFQWMDSVPLGDRSHLLRTGRTSSQRSIVAISTFRSVFLVAFGRISLRLTTTSRLGDQAIGTSQRSPKEARILQRIRPIQGCQCMPDANASNSMVGRRDCRFCAERGRNKRNALKKRHTDCWKYPSRMTPTVV